MEIKDVINEIKSLFLSEDENKEIKFKDFKTVDNLILRSNSEEDLKIGDILTKIEEDGTETILENGTYTLEDGTEIIIGDEGIVEDIKIVENEEEVVDETELEEVVIEEDIQMSEDEEEVNEIEDLKNKVVELSEMINVILKDQKDLAELSLEMSKIVKKTPIKDEFEDVSNNSEYEKDIYLSAYQRKLKVIDNIRNK